MIELAVLLLSILTAYYSWFILRVHRGLRPAKANGFQLRKKPFVSVIIPTRNEAKNIEGCLASVLAQDYPGNKFEIIVVDDDSTDRTLQIVDRLRKKHKSLRSFALPSRPNHDFGRKPDAIALGIQHAKGLFIATTDADCTVSPEWLQTMVEHAGPDIAFVSGPVIEISNGSLLNKIESIDYLGLITTGAGLIGIDRPIICSGANLLYRKTAFETVDGFRDGQSSCDDETLMQRIFVRNIGKIQFVMDDRAIVLTSSDNDLMSLWKQRMRWAAKKGRYEDRSILIELVCLYFFFFVLFMSAIVSLVVPGLRLPVLMAFGAKVIVDFLALARGARLLKQTLSLPYFLIAELFHTPYIVVAAAAGQFISQRWKGRKLDR